MNPHIIHFGLEIRPPEEGLGLTHPVKPHKGVPRAGAKLAQPGKSRRPRGYNVQGAVPRETPVHEHKPRGLAPSGTGEGKSSRLSAEARPKKKAKRPTSRPGRKLH